MRHLAYSEDRILYALQVLSLSFCDGRVVDFYYCCQDNPPICASDYCNAPGDHQALCVLYNCWLVLFRHDNEDDLRQALANVLWLRKEHLPSEANLFSWDSVQEHREMVMRLIALYHWVRATQILAEYVLGIRQENVFADVQNQFNLSIKSSTYKYKEMLNALFPAAKKIISFIRASNLSFS